LINTEQKAMDLSHFNDFMKKCNEKMVIRYVTPTIHAHFKIVTSIIIHTSYESKEFSITNNPDENFNLNGAVNDYIDNI